MNVILNLPVPYAIEVVNNTVIPILFKNYELSATMNNLNIFQLVALFPRLIWLSPFSKRTTFLALNVSDFFYTEDWERTFSLITRIGDGGTGVQVCLV